MPRRQPRQAKRQAERERPPKEREANGAEFPDINEEPLQPWLEPIGNTGFYQSPVEPVDPTDCDRWPDSPYCDGSGINKDDFIDLAPEIHYNGCEICVTLSPTLAYISLPPYTICYRRNSPDCIPEVPDPNIPDESPDPGSYTNPRRSCAEGDYVILAEYHDLTNVVRDTGEVLSAFIPEGTELGDALRIWYEAGKAFKEATLRATLSAYNAILGEVVYDSGEYLDNLANPFFYCNIVLFGSDGERHVLRRLVAPGISTIVRNQEYLAYGESGSFTVQYSIVRYTIDYDYIFNEVLPPCIGIAPPPTIPVPAPPLNNPSREPCCMNCAEQDRLLRLIAKRLGTDDYPASVPKSLLTGRERGQQKIESLTQFIGWFVQQVDALVGEFPVELTIEDIDPTKPGKQSKKVAVPNIAEAIAELYGLSLKNTVDSDIHTNFLMRLAAEIIATKNGVIVTQDYARANAAFLGYKANPKKRKVNYAFDPEGLESLETILKESTKYVQGWQEDDPETVVGFLQRIVFSAGIIKAAFLRNKDQLGNLKGDIDNLLKKSEGDQDELWRQFLRAVENPDHRFNQGNVPKPEIKDLSQTSNEGLSNLLGEQT
jgi:hypothetical protein